jgi:lipopolysaccharide export system protein LptC
MRMSEVRACRHHVTRARGGEGAAREFCDLLLTACGQYRRQCSTRRCERWAAARRNETRAWSLLRNALDRATIYLPIILTAAVALGTYWLVRNAPKLLEPTAKAAPSHEHRLFHARVHRSRTTCPTVTCAANFTARKAGTTPTPTPPKSTRCACDPSPRGLHRPRHGQPRPLEFRRQRDPAFRQRHRHPRSGVAANGKSTPRLEFRGEFLHAFLDTERVTSNKPVTLIRGTDQFTADTSTTTT